MYMSKYYLKPRQYQHASEMVDFEATNESLGGMK